MKKNTTPKPFTQSTFDKAFVAAVELIVGKDSRLPHPPNRKVLCKEIGIKSQFYDIKRGKRSVPKKNIDNAIKILNEKYQVRRTFLASNEGPILEDVLHEEINLSHEPPVHYGQHSHKDESAKTEVAYLRQLVAEKDRIIKLQEDMLSELQKKVQTK